MGIYTGYNFPQGNISIDYNDNTKRIENVIFDINIGYSVHTRIWRVDIDPITPVVDRTDSGNGTDTVPGNFQLIEVTDPFFGFNYLIMPSELRIEHEVAGPL